MPFADGMLKPTLHRLIKQHKLHKAQCAVDKIWESHGRTPLRLPPYHPDLNPIENIWATITGHIASRKSVCKVQDATRLCEEIFHSVGDGDWWPLYARVKNLEKEHYDKHARFNNVIDIIIVSLGGVESDNNDSSEEDNRSDTRDEEMDGIALITGSNG
jgi:transposase